MATIKVKFRPSSVSTKEGVVFYQVIHARVVRQISTGYKLFPSEWDDKTSAVSLFQCPYGRYDYLLSVQKRIEEDTSCLQRIIVRFERCGRHYTADHVIQAYCSKGENGDFFSFADELIKHMYYAGRERTAETYTTTLNSFMRFFKNRRDLYLDEIDSNLMIAYESYLKSTGLTQNTTSFYMRNLRAVYNRAVDCELTVQRYPFKYVYTGIDKTVKRAVSEKIVRKIRDLDLTLYPSLDYARDMFMFSFYTRGMSFIDMAYLTKKNLQGGILSYRRHKTNQQLFIKWEKPMQAILDKYDTSSSPYLLPIIKNPHTDTRRQYKTATHFVNDKLKKIGRLLDVPVVLTTYVARHAWASIAKSKNISLSVISEAMGHDSENTTRIYLASLDTSLVDKANRLIINLI